MSEEFAMTPEQVSDRLDTELKHVATKADLHRELSIQTRWLVGTVIALQVPTWIGMIQIWSFLATIVSKLPK
jgi:hypothetical protein